MEWLREILAKAAVSEEGKLDVGAVLGEIRKAFPNHAVPKSDFNDKVKELKSANDTIRELKKANGDNEDLQGKISDYEAEIRELRKTAEDTQKTYALKEQLGKAGVIDPDYLIYKAGGIEKFTFDKENSPVGVEDAIKPYKEDKAMAHLFKQEEKKPPYQPHGGGTDHAGNPFAKETFNMTKQGELFRTNPEQARALASAAGVKI